MQLSDKQPAPLRVLVVDDEPLARCNVTALLKPDPTIASVTECGSFDVLEQLGSDLPSTIIFVTAHNDYALRAFEAGALDYLLKPFDDARFQRALSRAKDKLAHYAPLQRQP